MNPVYMLKSAALHYAGRAVRLAFLLALLSAAAFLAMGCGHGGDSAAADSSFDAIEIDTAVDCSLLPLPEARCCVCEALGGTDCVDLCAEVAL